MTRTEMETALDGGRLFARMNSGNWWKLRRNGKTKTWKTRPKEFRIPVKAGIWTYGALTETTASDNLVIKD